MLHFHSKKFTLILSIKLLIAILIFILYKNYFRFLLLDIDLNDYYFDFFGKFELLIFILYTLTLYLSNSLWLRLLCTTLFVSSYLGILISSLTDNNFIEYFYIKNIHLSYLPVTDFLFAAFCVSLLFSVPSNSNYNKLLSVIYNTKKFENIILYTLLFIFIVLSINGGNFFHSTIYNDDYAVSGYTFSFHFLYLALFIVTSYLIKINFKFLVWDNFSIFISFLFTCFILLITSVRRFLIYWLLFLFIIHIYRKYQSKLSVIIIMKNVLFLFIIFILFMFIGFFRIENGFLDFINANEYTYTIVGNFGRRLLEIITLSEIVNYINNGIYLESVPSLLDSYFSLIYNFNGENFNLYPEIYTSDYLKIRSDNGASFPLGLLSDMVIRYGTDYVFYCCFLLIFSIVIYEYLILKWINIELCYVYFFITLGFFQAYSKSIPWLFYLLSRQFLISYILISIILFVDRYLKNNQLGAE